MYPLCQYCIIRIPCVNPIGLQTCIEYIELYERPVAFARIEPSFIKVRRALLVRFIPERI